ncbi:MAG TPA: glycosyltransferase [Pyrinomonadaceae bacterium]|nr:glycosyltransferase [Pyrinomonadaceae bacterium]
MRLRAMRVLITNFDLAMRGGTQLYVRDLALGLLRRGHLPIIYSLNLGAVARELQAATVPVVNDLNALAAPPDIIHGQHHLETMTALLRFPGVPAVYFCHGWMGWTSAPPRFPRILRYVAVDQAARDRLVFQNGIPEDETEVILNFVDLRRFKPRAPLPARPARALMFSNYAREATSIRVAREACESAGIKLDCAGDNAGKPTARPEDLLGRYDIVFAKGRSALEALAVGASVVLCGVTRAGPLVTAENLERLRPLNFGIRALDRPLDASTLSREIARYDSADAAQVSRRIRAAASVDATVEAIISLYEEVIAEHETAGGRDAGEEGRAAAEYLRQLHADIAAHSAATLRLRNRLMRAPVLGRVLLRLARVSYVQDSRLLKVPVFGGFIRGLARAAAGEVSR